ncbi:bifunctional oligoribonuclease/PAP phosphatase NrnA [Candidatus Dojkabacteria bacterium]|nr:bifunctional oligoribonuclease/PAP phosphatase NrnA [Candidatus Dojkabacteria bacterium]
MNYSESQLVLDEIKKAKRILINCHTNPDADSIGSAFALNEVLKVYFQKDVTIIYPDDLPENTLFIKDSLYGEVVTKKIDFNTFNFSEYDLFIALDSSSWDRVRGGGNKEKIDIKTIVIDHHHTNTRFGEINIVDDTMSSTAELLYFVFNDWGINPDREVDYPFFQKALLTGIISDTECFRTKVADSKTMKVASDLMRFSSKDEIIKNLYQSNSITTLRAISDMLANISINEESNFCYTYIRYEEYSRNKLESFAKDMVADFFINSVSKTDFGFIAVEKQKGETSVSFRARTDFDTSIIAKELGGGGHKIRSAVTIRNMDFEIALKRILDTCQKYSNKDK